MSNSEYREHDEDFLSDEEDEEEDDDYTPYESEHDDDDDHEKNHKYQHQEERDEQKEQVYTGKIELLQQEVENLKNELKAEKESHEETKKVLDDSILNEQNKIAKLTKKDSKVSKVLLNEFKTFCMVHNIRPSSSSDNLDELHDEDYKYVLQEATRRLQAVPSEDFTRKIQRQPSTRASVAPQSESELAVRVRSLEAELRVALSAADDIRALKAKLVYMVERTRVEKEQKLKVDTDAALLRKTIKMLSDHIEKLMSHLKHEATAKIKIIEKQRQAEKRANELEELTSLLTKKNGAKDRLILELREGSKILEDQLRLMDEKFLELRSKLDWVRENDEKKSKRAAKEAAELRAKIAELNMNSRAHTESLPDIYDSNNNNIYRDITTGESNNNIFDSSKRKKKAGKKKEITIEQVIGKLRKQNDAKAEWTEERARELIKKPTYQSKINK